MDHLVIPHRFNGPPSSGNGGWSAGALAQTLVDHAGDVAVSVRLMRPPPLAVPMPLERAHATVSASAGGHPVAVARLPEDPPSPVAPVPVEVAAAAEEQYAGLRAHPFPTCFVCGPQRRAGDGLRIFPGPVPGREATVAATWTPYEASVPIIWAALDCPSGWASDIENRPVVLGTITALVHHLPSTRERYVVVGEVRGVDGRKTLTASTVYGPDDEVVATAEQVWIAIDPEDFS